MQYVMYRQQQQKMLQQHLLQQQQDKFLQHQHEADLVSTAAAMASMASMVTVNRTEEDLVIAPKAERAT
jgi:DNA polymerase IIIc chi subunit